MAWLQGIESLRGTADFAKSYLWDIQFPDSPLPDWFPASSVDEPIAQVTSYDFEYHILQFSVPKSLQKHSLSITFYDTIDLQIASWLDQWVHQLMFPNYRGVAPLENITKKCRIAKLTLQKEIRTIKIYDVYPDESMVHNWNSNSEHKLLSVSFVVAGETDET